MIRVGNFHRRLREHYELHNWWPADSPFEIMIGALLVQRTLWQNVEVALKRLASAGLLHPQKLAQAEVSTLIPLLQPVGFHRVKSSRLVGLARFVVDHGGIEALAGMPQKQLERALSAVAGIGRETETAIRLYAFDQAVWVRDAYSRRIFSRMDPRLAEESAERRYIAPLVKRGDTAALKELHGLIVEHAKRHCRSIPQCEGCVLAGHCRHVSH